MPVFSFILGGFFLTETAQLSDHTEDNGAFKGNNGAIYIIHSWNDCLNITYLCGVAVDIQCYNLEEVKVHRLYLRLKFRKIDLQMFLHHANNLSSAITLLSSTFQVVSRLTSNTI